MGGLDLLLGGRAGSEQWREGIEVLEQELQKRKVQEVEPQKGADCP